MPRSNYSSAMAAADQSSVVRPAWFLQITFISGVAYMWSGIGPRTWNSNVYTGIGSILSLSAIEEASTVQSRGIIIGLSGMTGTLLSDVLADYQLGLPVFVYRGNFDVSGNLIVSPVLAWAGLTDKPKVNIGADTSTLEIACETQMIDATVEAGRRRTNDDFTEITPGDQAGSFVAGIQNITILFGSTTSGERNI